MVRFFQTYQEAFKAARKCRMQCDSKELLQCNKNVIILPKANSEPHIFISGVKTGDKIKGAFGEGIITEDGHILNQVGELLTVRWYNNTPLWGWGSTAEYGRVIATLEMLLVDADAHPEIVEFFSVSEDSSADEWDALVEECLQKRGPIPEPVMPPLKFKKIVICFHDNDFWSVMKLAGELILAFTKDYRPFERISQEQLVESIHDAVKLAIRVKGKEDTPIYGGRSLYQYLMEDTDNTWGTYMGTSSKILLDDAADAYIAEDSDRNGEALLVDFEKGIVKTF
jgi:hypothetical protein